VKASTHKRLYNWHSLTGLITTLLLVALCLTALPAIFVKDISSWLTPTEKFPAYATTPSLNTWLTQANDSLDLQGQEFHISTYDINQPYKIWIEKDEKYLALIQNSQGEFIQHDASAASAILAKVHHNFLLPDPYGEYIVGLVGLSMLGLVLMGVVLHKKWKKEKTQLRKDRSKRVFLSDIHKLLGLWLLPFHIFVSYTGATLGLGNLLIIVAALSAFNGDQKAAVEAVLGEEPVLSGEVCQTPSIEDLIKRTDKHWNDKYGASDVIDIEIHGYNDCNGQIAIGSSIPGYLLQSNALIYSIKDQSIIKEIDWISAGAGERWYASLVPLHFGTYAGYLSQWLFFISAILLTIMVISGMLLWLDKQGQLNIKSYFIRGCAGITMGITFATTSILLLAKFISLGFGSESYDFTFYKIVYAITFMLAFLSCTIHFKLMTPWLYLNGLIFLTLPIVNQFSTQFSFENIGADIVFLIVSITLFLASIKLKKLQHNITQQRT